MVLAKDPLHFVHGDLALAPVEEDSDASAHVGAPLVVGQLYRRVEHPHNPSRAPSFLSDLHRQVQVADTDPVYRYPSVIVIGRNVAQEYNTFLQEAPGRPNLRNLRTSLLSKSSVMS